MFGSALLKRIGTSSNQIDIENISHGILKLPSSKYCQVLATTSLNFELKSEEEQDALIDTYEGFLNSLSFPIQILVRTREIDMGSYLNVLKEKIDIELVSSYREQLKSYRQFISKLVYANKILSRQFYVVIPFEASSGLSLDLTEGQLSLRTDIVAKNLTRLGINCRILTSIELVDLFYSFFAPKRSKLQPISEKALEVITSEFITKARGNA